MVRVMSIYHFSSQSIEQLSIDELSACCLIPPNHIALAKNAEHTIEVRKLRNDCDGSNIDADSKNDTKTFSSVDDVHQLIYSPLGNFLISVESRISNYEKNEIRYVRIYVNWDLSSPNSQAQSLRARIAGKITPIKKSLEMIELPLICNLTSIACCESTGNIIVSYKNIVQFYFFKYCTNDTTKLQYVDFFEAPFHIELNFVPSKLLMSENMIFCCNNQFLHAFKIVDLNVDDYNSLALSESQICTSTEVQDQPLENINLNLEYDIDIQGISQRKELNGIEYKVELKSNEEETIELNDGEFKPLIVTELTAAVKRNPNSTMFINLVVKSLLQLKLQALKFSGVVHDNANFFKSMSILPLYVQPIVSESNEGFSLHSKFHQHFYGCAVLINTQQDGYLYQISANSTILDQTKSFLNVYPFTSPVIDVYFNSSVIHALCENGIETYTHRIGQKLYYDLSNKDRFFENSTIYKNLSTTISLVNLRPFMNVYNMLPCKDSVILLASDSPLNVSSDSVEAVNWTLYNLKLPSIDTIYQDFKEFADKSLKRYPSFYMNLLEEVHIMIRTQILLGHIKPEVNCEMGNELKLLWENYDELLAESSYALADFLILNDSESEHSLVFYQMANLNITLIFQRFLDLNGLNTISFSPHGLIKALKSSFQKMSTTHDNMLFDEVFSSIINFPEENDKILSLKFGEALIELFRRFAPKEISKIALDSAIFREYMDERIYDFLIVYNERGNEEMLNIILHLLKVDEIIAANSLLDQIKRDDLYKLLIRYWNILFELSTNSTKDNNKKKFKNITSFSDFTELLFLKNSTLERSELLTSVLLYHMHDTKIIKINTIVKLFIEYLASQFGYHESYLGGQNILKMIIEKYLLKYYETRTSQDAEISLMLATSSSTNTSTISASSVSDNQNDNHKISERKLSFMSWNDEQLQYENTPNHKHALRILIRIYLSQLKMLSLKQIKRTTPDMRINKGQVFKLINEMSTGLFINQKPVTKFDNIAQLLINYEYTDPILFLDERYRYLDSFPPFENILQLFCNKNTLENQYEYAKLEKDLLLTLIKLQALLCSGEISSDIAKEVMSYLDNNHEIIGHDSIMICLVPLHKGIDLIIESNPQCILEFSRCHLKLDQDWCYLIRKLQVRVNNFEVCEANMGHILFYQRLLKETLEYLASTKPLDTVLKIFPDEKHLINNNVFKSIDSNISNDLEDYAKKCVDLERSGKIKKMIEQTGEQLYSAINK